MFVFTREQTSLLRYEFCLGDSDLSRLELDFSLVEDIYGTLDSTSLY